MRISYSVISFAYILSTSFLSWGFNLSELTKSIIALPSYLLIPILIGNGLVQIFRNKVNRKNIDIFSNGILLWIYGSISSVLIALILNILGFFSIFNYIIPCFLLILIGVAFDKSNFLEKKIFGQFKTIELFIVFLIGLIPALIVINHSPFPLIQTQMVFVLNDAIYRILDNYLWVPMSYSPLWFLNHATSSVIFNVSPFALIWSHKFILYPMLSIGIFLFSFSISNKKSLSLLASFLGMWILLGIEINVPIRSVPNFVLLTIFPYMLYFINNNIVIKNYKNVSKNFKWVTSVFLLLTLLIIELILVKDMDIRDIAVPLTILFLLIFVLYLVMLNIFSYKAFYLLLIGMVIILHHTFESIFYVTIIIFYILCFYSLKIKPKETSLILRVFIILFFIVMWLQINKLIDIDNLLSVPPSYYVFGDTYSSYASFDFFDKYKFLTDPTITYPRNSAAAIYLLLFGILYNVFSKNNTNLLLTSTIVFIFSIYFFPEPFTYRIDHMSRTFSSFMIAYFLVGIYSQVQKRFYRIKIANLYLFLMIIVLSLQIVLPLIIFTSNYQNGFSVDEYETAVWVRENMGENTMIISDFQSMLIYQGIAHTIPFTERGMLVEETSNKSQETYHLIQEKILLTSNSNGAYENLQLSKEKALDGDGIDTYLTKRYLNKTNKVDMVNNANMLVIISPRTSKWVESGKIEPILESYSHENVDGKLIEKFMNSTYFTLLYVHNNIYAFGVNNYVTS